MRTPLASLLLVSFACLVACIAFSAIAQEVPPLPTPPRAAPTTRSVAEAPAPARVALTDDQGNSVPGVRLAKADLRAVVRGPLAQVTVTLTFANETSQVLGGELMFPLPDGATVSGYGLEVNGSMVDGVAVDKQQARDIYRNEAYRRIDPGLVEHVAGNAFHTRLYPIPAMGSRSARVQYVTEVPCAGGRALLSLPMDWADADKCSMSIETPGLLKPVKGSKPVWPEAGSMAFHTPSQGIVTDEAMKEAPDGLVIRLEDPPARSASIEQRPRELEFAREPEGETKGQSGGSDPAKRFEQFDYHFLLTDTPPAPPPELAPQAAAELKSKAVRRLAILWDAELNRAASDKRHELELLDSLLKGWGGVTGDLVVFRDTVEAPVSFDLGTPDGRGKLIEQLSRLTYDGGSDLGDLPLPKNAAGFVGVDRDKRGGDVDKLAAAKPAGNYDCLLLFTDGMDDIGPRTIHMAESPLYVFSDDPRANTTRLQKVCQDSGGRYFNLTNLAGDRTSEPWSLLSVEFKPDEVAEVFPAGPIPVQGLARLTLTGRLLKPRATVTLDYGYGNRVMHRQPFTLRIADATGGDLIARFWAQRKVADLSIEADLNERELTRIGKRFNLVTPYTSLLVLETADQYERYRVVPPKSRPEIHQQFVDKMGQPPFDWDCGEDVNGVSIPGAGRVVIMGQDPSRESDPEALLGTVTVWDSHVHWWQDPAAFMAPPPQPMKDNDVDWSDPRTADRRTAMQHAANLRRSRELTREALRARQAGDFPDAIYLYDQAVLLNPDNTLASRGQRELVEGSVGEDGNSARRGRLKEQARKRSADSAAAFQAALDRSRQDADQHDLTAAESEIQQARAALATLGVWGADDLTAFGARLAEAQHGLDTARLAAARNARETREKLISDAHARRATDVARGRVNSLVGVNIGGGYHRGDFRSGAGLFGGGGGAANTSLFAGNAAGGSPAPESPAATAGPPLASIGAMTSLASNLVQPWDPAMPYLAALRGAPPDKVYQAYLQQRATFGRSPDFYLDCSDYLVRPGQQALAARAVSDVTAFHLADPSLLRRAACRFQELGEWDRAIELLERVAEMRPDSLRGYRDLALALADRADAMADLTQADSRRDGNRIAADYSRCLDLLNRVIVREARLSEVDLSCLMDANRVIARVRRLESAGEIPPVQVPLDPRLIRDLDCDLRVVMTSDTDDYSAYWTVTDPDGDPSSGGYATRIGGRCDGGEYCLRKLLPGLYRVQMTGFVGIRPERLTSVCTVRVRVFTDFGRASEKSKSLNVRVTNLDQKVDIVISAFDGLAPVFQKPDNLLSTETSP